MAWLMSFCVDLCSFKTVTHQQHNALKLFFFFLDSAGCAFVSCEHLCLTYFSLLLCGCFLQNLIFILFYFFFCLYYFQKWRCIHNVCWLCTNQERNVISHYPINNTWENNYDRSEFQTGQMTSTDLRRWHIWFC